MCVCLLPQEFLAATIGTHVQLREEMYVEAFEQLDADGTGFISKQNLKELLGDDYDERTVNGMIEEVDTKDNGRIDIEEFLQMMRSEPPGNSPLLLSSPRALGLSPAGPAALAAPGAEPEEAEAAAPLPPR